MILGNGNGGKQLATFKQKMSGFNGRLIGEAHNNPLLDTREHEIANEDGQSITTLLYQQVDSEGHEFMLKEIFVGRCMLSPSRHIVHLGITRWYFTVRWRQRTSFFHTCLLFTINQLRP